MRAATAPRERPHEARLLWIDPQASRWTDATVADLPCFVRRDDLLVVNDAATLPVSLRARTVLGAPVEVRLAGAPAGPEWLAVLFGAGDWRERTEDRALPPSMTAGDRLIFVSGADGFEATIVAVSVISRRLVTLRFDREGSAFWDALYRSGRPIQYSYLSGPLDLWDVQTPYASRPWAAEPPSAGLPLGWGLLSKLRAQGVELGWITEAAGLSSTGDPAIDAALPLPERFEVPASTVRAVAEARAAGGRVIAAGTTVLRALEGAAALHGGRLVACDGVTDLRVGPGFEPAVVDAILTGLHEPGTSHYALLHAFAAGELLDAAHAHAEDAGFLGHEFGDLCLISRSR